jgi:WD40 repeat protein
MSKYSVIQQRLKYINELLEGELANLNNQPNNLLKYNNDISAVQDNLRNYNEAFLAHNEKVYDDLKVFQRNIDHLFKMSDVNRAMEQDDKTKENIKEKLLSLKNSEIIGKHDDVIRCAILLPDNYIATASDDKTIKIWGLNNKTCVQSFEGHKDHVNFLALLSDDRLAPCSSDCTIKIWDFKESKYVLSKNYNATICYLLLLSDGRLASSCINGIIGIWDNNKNYKLTRTVNANSFTVTSLTNLTIIILLPDLKITTLKFETNRSS